MANYSVLNGVIQSAIYTNGNNEISAQDLQDTLIAMVSELGNGYQYKGIATLETTPGLPDPNVFYITSTPGTYTNFGNLVVADGEIAILKYNGTWTKDTTGAISRNQLLTIIPVNFANYAPASGWIQSNGSRIGNDQSLHYAIPLAQEVEQIKITAKSTAASVTVFASSVSGDNWTPVGERSVISEGTTVTLNKPSNATYIIVGARSGAETPSDDYYLPQYLGAGVLLNSIVAGIEQDILTNSPINLNLYDKLSGWILENGNRIEMTGALHYAIPLTESAKSVFVQAKTGAAAVAVFASAISGDSWTPIGTRYTISANSSATLPKPSSATYLIVGSRNSDSVEIDHYAPQSLVLKDIKIKDALVYIDYYLNRLYTTIKEDERIELPIDFAQYTPTSGWIQPNGNRIDTAQSLHYSIPLDSEVAQVKITAKSTAVSVIAFASSISGNTWTPTGERIVVATGETMTLDKPSTATYIIVGARSGSETPSDDYYLPQSLVIPQSIKEAIKRNANNIERNTNEITILKTQIPSKNRQAGGFRFSTYNIGRFSHGNQAASVVTQATYATDLANYKGIIKDIDADILFLDEYNDVFCADYGGSPRYAKDVLFSEFPIRHIEADIPDAMYNVSCYSYPYLHNITKGYIQSENARYYIMAEYKLHGVTIKIVNMHLGFTLGDNDAKTLTQLSELIAMLAQDDHVILSGDMNMLADKTHFSVLTNAGYTIANCGTFGDFATYNGSDQGGQITNRCIDQIATKGFRMSNVKMITSTDASDHYPLCCDLILSNF